MRTIDRYMFLSVLCAALVLAGCGGGGGDAAPAASHSDTPAAKPAAVASGDLPALPAGSASVKGSVTYNGKVPNLRPLKMDADPGCAKKHSGDVMPEVLVLGENNRLGNIFVYVKSGLPQPRYAPPAEPVVMDQRGCQYAPHVMGVMIGQPFRVVNSDGLLHNVHSLPKENTPFNRAMPASVTQADYVYTKQEVGFKIKCDVHPWMNAYVSVLPHPFYAVTGTDGSFEISGLPAGTYQMEAWHEKMPAQEFSVTLADGESKNVDLTFTM